MPQRLGLTLRQIGEELQITNQTILANIKRDPSHRLYLKAFKVAPKEYRVYWEDLVDFINRNYVGAEIKFT
ncbi:hypothetical protein [Pontibacter diazotrophicus]|uniref:hypothetical protein n=1 Tax=Pontibacter diazotrophicus TaxID=1400979 RepID=UPI0011C06024|nr:hypothetical protein [Pontibacter diazotrophicus]